jgi:hypothetical protein
MITSFVDRPFVYIAGPYVRPDPVENTHQTIKWADELQASGLITAYVPHLSLLWHIVVPHEPDYWYEYDLAILARCDALLRLPGESTGADNEVKFALEQNPPMPVFYEIGELIAWARLR